MRILLCWTVLLCLLGLPARGETVGSIPRPRPGTWAVDTTGTLSTTAISGVNLYGSEVDHKGLGQLAVVVVRTTEGVNPRDFATGLFNQWGIGHAGRNDGALLFIALRDRKAEIVLGDGVSSRADTNRSDALMSGEIVPAFKRGDPQAAVLAGARGLSSLLEHSPLNGDVAGTTTAPQEAPPVQGSYDPGYTTARMETTRSYEDVSPWLYGSGAGGLVLGGLGLRRWLRRRPRICEGCQLPRQLLDEDSDDAHLDRGQRLEEKLGSVDYDAWWCESCQDVRVERYGAWLTSYSQCPGCGYKTKSESTSTIRSATYDHGGLVEVTVTCKHCSHRDRFTRSTPRLTRSSSSSSGGSRSSSSSSFGGGRSSGGGSSGSW
ncbi:TPM domain-containing protein [Archangium sp.]|uniref:TPM domain-containing protein n=1 Tax=Archangium sp. TaxID=1872627 RepID=UPI00389A3F39